MRITTLISHLPPSRWQDVSQHWNSLCKLLGETLLHLEATFAEVRHVLQTTKEEFEWLERCEHAAAVHRTTHGNLQIVQEEIDTYYVSENLVLNI